MSDEYRILRGDCLDRMRELDDGSVDAIVTDPPYGLAFMGAKWDTFGRDKQHGNDSMEVRRKKALDYATANKGALAFQEAMTPIFSEAMRVAKPGAHLLCFGGTRTFHRMTCAIEDAGWEIRDCIMWVTGQGLPKSMDVGKAIDKVRGKSENFQRMYAKAVKDSRMSHAEIDRELGIKSSSCYWVRTDERKSFPTRENWEKLKHILPFPDNADEIYDEAERLDRVVGRYGDNSIYDKSKSVLDAGTPITQQAKEWDGWGTCLKPAWEPIIVARKPLDGTVAHNVMTYGTGAINIDGCRVPTDDKLGGGMRAGGADGVWDRPFMHDEKAQAEFVERKRANVAKSESLGRFPANLVHDGSQEVLELFPDTNPSRKGRPRSGRNGMGWGMTHTGAEYDDAGSAARFFYCAKASKKDRGEGNDHPTVKPNALMRWLVRLVCPQGGIVLDPFMGSGSTGVACIQEGMRFFGIDMDEHYCDVADQRMRRELDGGIQRSMS